MSKVAWPSSCSIVSIQYWLGTTFASTRTSPDPVDVDAERVLALAVAREEVAAREHVVGLEADAVVRPARELDEVGASQVRVEVDAALGRDLLEEGVGVVPRRELGGGTPEAGGEAAVEVGLPAGEGLGRGAVGVVEGRDQLAPRPSRPS